MGADQACGAQTQVLVLDPLAKPGRALHQAFGQEQLPVAILLEIQDFKQIEKLQS